MKKQISHISVHQTSKVLSLLYFNLTSLFGIPMAIAAGLGHHNSEAWIWIALPFAYLIRHLA